MFSLGLGFFSFLFACEGREYMAVKAGSSDVYFFNALLRGCCCFSLSLYLESEFPSRHVCVYSSGRYRFLMNVICPGFNVCLRFNCNGAVLKSFSFE